MNLFLKFLEEAFLIKVNYKGVKRKKLSCPPGYKPNAEGTACVPMDAAEKTNLKNGSREANRTKKSEGASMQKRQRSRTKKAMRFRTQLGL